MFDQSHSKKDKVRIKTRRVQESKPKLRKNTETRPTDLKDLSGFKKYCTAGPHSSQ